MTPNELEMDWLKRWALYAPSAVALQSGEDGRAFTYADLRQSALRLAGVLKTRFGISRGDRIACLAQNELEYVVLFFAAHRLGAILVPVNFRFAPPEVEHVVRDCEPKLVVVQSQFRRGVAGLGSHFTFWNFDGADSMVDACHIPEVRDQGEFAARFDDPCMILYTSGTTGAPKGAVLSHRMVFWNSINTGLRLDLTRGDVTLNFAPLFHTGGWNVLMTPSLHRGAKTIMLRKFDPDLILRLCEREKVSILFGLPTTMDFLRRARDFETTDLRSIRFAIVGGEPMPLELIVAWEERGIAIRQGYGLTEFGPNVFSLNQEDSRRKMGSIGFPNFYIEAKVVDDSGHEVKPREIGELALRGPVAMSGYWRNETATRETIRDGWLHTGDLVRRDKDGYFFVVGRKKDMYISGGENVYPAEVEKVLRTFPGVREAAVIGVKHPKWGESGRAFLSLETGETSVSEASLRDHCVAHLAKFKVPAEFVVLPDLPKTDSGKIAKKLLANHDPMAGA